VTRAAYSDRVEPRLSRAAGVVGADTVACASSLDDLIERGQVIRGPWFLAIATGTSVDATDKAFAANAAHFEFRPGNDAAPNVSAQVVPLDIDDTLRFPTLRRRRSALGKAAFTLAALLHLAPVYLLLQVPAGTGVGGRELEAVSIELVDASVLDAQRESRELGAGTAQSVAATTGSSVSSAASPVTPAAKDVVQVKPLEKSTLPNVEPPVPTQQQVLVVPKADWSVDLSANLPVVEPPRREPASDPNPDKKPIVEDVAKQPVTIPSNAASGGTTGGAEATANTALQSTPSAGQVAASQGEINRFVASIRSALARTKPNGRGRTGTALVAFAILSDGQIDFVKIEKSSGNVALDQSALDAVRRAAPFKVPPSGMAESALRFTIPYRFE
jgi:periplasmic protein TonB